MSTANRTSYALLGLLAQGPKSGYEIKQIVEKTISHFWKESYGHIYPTLNRLMANGLVVRVAIERGSGIERSRYTITEAGRLALAEWLAAPLEIEGTRNELALRIYFGSYAPISVSRTLLEAHQAHHQALLERYALEQKELQTSSNQYELITLSLGVHISLARVAWCHEALERLKRLAEQEQHAN